MHIDEARGDVEGAHIHDAPGKGRRDILRHGGDVSLGDGDVAHGVDAVLGVDDVSTLQQEIVAWLGVGGRAREQENQQSKLGHLL